MYRWATGGNHRKEGGGGKRWGKGGGGQARGGGVAGEGREATSDVGGTFSVFFTITASLSKYYLLSTRLRGRAVHS